MMNQNNKPISLKQLLTETKVVVPNIQRGYAQGRPNKAFVRTGILGSFKSALEKSDFTPLVLDFVYGSRINGCFQPLDGQQRLTTLWLLHWYLAFMTNQNDKDTSFLLRFCYETRRTSSEFCAYLCGMHLGDDAQFITETERLSDYIRNQVWFKAEYDTDPTIIGMLNTLSGDKEKQDNIQSIFGLNGEVLNLYWTRLVDHNAICFYKQELTDNGLELTDDLYIKMNARGKQLTAFENFKADLLGLTYGDGNKLLNDDDARKLDNDWLDMFWDANPNEGSTKLGDLTRSQRADRAYFKFINMYLLNKVMADSSDNKSVTNSEVFKTLYDDNGDSYTSISVYKEHIVKYWEDLRKLFDNYKAFLEKTKDNPFSFEAPENYKSQNAKFTFEYAESEDDESKKNLRRRIMTYGVCRFFEKIDKNDNVSWDGCIDNLKDWMHFLWNIVDCQALAKDTQATMINVIRKLKGYGEGASNIVEFLCNPEQSPENDSEKDGETAHEQFEEERYKAKIAKKNNEKYSEMFKVAEILPYTRGTIRCLLKGENGVYLEDFDISAFKAKLEKLESYIEPKDRIAFTQNLWRLVTDWDTVFKSVIFFDISDDSFRRNLNELQFASAVSIILSGGSISNSDFKTINYNSHEDVLKNIKEEITKLLNENKFKNQVKEWPIIQENSAWRFEEKDGKVRFCLNYHRDDCFLEFK